jgi:hypothetical protein
MVALLEGALPAGARPVVALREGARPVVEALVVAAAEALLAEALAV